MQQDIAVILQKLKELNTTKELHVIDVDLMLQHTRTLYDKLLEMRSETQPLPISESDNMPAIAKSEHVDTAALEEKPISHAMATEQEVQEEIELVEPLDILSPIQNAEPTLEDIIQEAEHVVETEPIAITDTIYTEQPAQTVVTNAAVATEDILSVKTVAEKDIRRNIGINDKYQYISELFGNNKDAYEAALTRLNRFESYPDAVNWMDEVHTENRWDDEHPTVISFYDMLRQFFSSK